MNIMNYVRTLGAAVRLHQEATWAELAAADALTRREDAEALAAFEADELRFWTPGSDGEPIARDANVRAVGGQTHTVEMRIIQVADRPTSQLMLVEGELDAMVLPGSTMPAVHRGADDSWADQLKAVREDIEQDPRVEPGVPEITSDELAEAEIEQAREDAEWAAIWRNFDQWWAEEIFRLEKRMAGWLSSTPGGEAAVWKMFSEARVRDRRIAEAAGEAVTQLFATPVTPRVLPHPGNNTSPKRLRHRGRRKEQKELIAA